MKPMPAPSRWRANTGPRCLKVPAWPTADRRAWEAALHPGDGLEPGGRGASWAAASRKARSKDYGTYLRWLEVTGRLDPLGSPADRVNADNVRGYIADLRLVNASTTLVARIGGLCSVMRGIAPDGDWDWLGGVEGRLKRTAVPVRDKPSRLVPSARLCAFGARLMNEADADRDKSPFKKAVQFRDGLVIAVLAARPLRRRNFTSIEIGRHLLRDGDGYVLRFDRGETKNHEPIDLPFPAALAPYLHRYLAEYRPFLLKGAGSIRARRRPPGDALWLSDAGSAMSEQSFYLKVCRLTLKEFGHSICPHLFRDCAATSTAIEDPDHMGMIRISLGHKSHVTAERHYIHAGTREAVARHQRAILSLRAPFRGRKAR